jgi:hypothetical protein
MCPCFQHPRQIIDVIPPQLLNSELRINTICTTVRLLVISILHIKPESVDTSTVRPKKPIAWIATSKLCKIVFFGKEQSAKSWWRHYLLCQRAVRWRGNTSWSRQMFSSLSQRVGALVVFYFISTARPREYTNINHGLYYSNLQIPVYFSCFFFLHMT